MSYGLLDQSVQYLKGVGPRRAEQLGRLGVNTARDLVYHVPRRYEDASTVTKIAALQVGQDATVIGEITHKAVHKTKSGLRVFQAMIRDGSGHIECSWPGQPFLDRSLHKGDLILVTGPVRYFHGRQLQPREHIVLGPASEATSEGKVLPIYPSTEGLSQKVLRGIIDRSLDRLLPLIASEDAVQQANVLPKGMATLLQALEALHRPESLDRVEHGRRRLAYDELFYLQLLHARARQRARTERAGTAFERTDRLIASLYRGLPFELTAAQTRSVAEIFADMTSPRRMNRLLQGDVGSGKTIVAAFAMMLAAESGYQSALMAPTEILAEQHARNLTGLLTELPLTVTLLTGRLPAAERREAQQAIAAGDAHVVVGTHALIQESVSFQRLGLAIVDEQHRFGVRQRLALSSHGEAPDVLVMSATPIPRSLALTLYGDLDLSTLDELPPGRTPVRTAVRDEKARPEVHEHVRQQVEQGRQAYIVYPLIDESEKVELRAAAEDYESLRTEIFPDLRVGLLHGQLSTEDRESTMRAFVAGDIDVLVSTTVIEVGIDVPNATVMVVEHAERFGLSQLHQLRGRVGRGADQSFCILIASGPPDAFARLRILARTNDGFEIAREDLRLRGMGEFFGARQHGWPEFRFFDPERDEDLLTRARDSASATVERDPDLASGTNSALRNAMETRYRERERLSGVG